MVDLVREVTWSRALDRGGVVRGGEEIDESWGCPGWWTVQPPERVETVHAEGASKNGSSKAEADVFNRSI